MEKATKIYWAAYEKAIDIKIQEVIDEIEPKFKTRKYSLIFRKKVHEACKRKFNGIDGHRDSFKLIAVIIDKVDFHGFPTNEVYNLYQYYCKSLGFEIIKKEYFTRFVCNYFGYTVVSKRLKRLDGKACRIFIREASA